MRLKIGDLMRQEGSDWRLAETNESLAFTSSDNAPAAENAGPAAGAAPNSSSAPNDILKKLMQQRAQELK